MLVGSLFSQLEIMGVTTLRKKHFGEILTGHKVLATLQCPTAPECYRTYITDPDTAATLGEQCHLPPVTRYDLSSAQLASFSYWFHPLLPYSAPGTPASESGKQCWDATFRTEDEATIWQLGTRWINYFLPTMMDPICWLLSFVTSEYEIIDNCYT
jgi:hypothetical protein